MAASGVIDLFATNIRAIAPRLREAGYRRALGDEPEGGSDGMFMVDVPSGTQGRPMFGDGCAARVLTVVVLVRYFRVDRRAALRSGADDMRRLRDMCSDPRSYSTATNGVRSITYLGGSRVADEARSEIWEARFSVEWQNDPA